MEYQDFIEDFINEYNNKEFNIINNLLNKLIDNDFDKTDIISNDYKINVSVEKIHALQENVFLTFSKNNKNIFISYESGINNGTQITDYSFKSDITPTSRVYFILDNIVLDKEKIQNWLDIRKRKKVIVNWNKVRLVFENYKPEILKLYKNQNYDNYVTGGGTNKTNAYYNELKKKLHNIGLFWTVEYKEIKGDVNWK